MVAAAALLHDIGIHAAERKYGSSAGVYQEKEGPPIARKVMEELNFSPGTIEHVCWIVGSHPRERDILPPDMTGSFRRWFRAAWVFRLAVLPIESAKRGRRSMLIRSLS